jgi:isopenicillin-N epimerase
MNKRNNLKSQFLLHPEIAFLNFGSFGACPKPIFEDYQRWQLELEREPVQFLAVNGPENLKRSREALATYIHCDADDVVLVTNPSYGLNIVAKSLRLKPGDEILSTDLEYGASDKTWNYYCKKQEARYVRQKVSLPVADKDSFIQQFFRGLSNKTKMVFISHITSSTALKFPVKEICEIAKEKGLITFVDGAHVPGQIPLDLSQLKADIYTGACHKWMMTPKGCSFLYVKRELQDRFDPLLISWGYDSAFPSHSRFIDYHQMQGTRDISAFLTIPKSIEFMRENNWKEVSASCRELANSNRARFCDLLDTEPLAPPTDEFLTQMCSFPIRSKEPEKLQRVLYEKYRVEIPVMRHDEKLFLRYSIQACNSQEDLDRLHAALKELKSQGTLLN